MAITINGTTGISGVDGSASTPALQGADTNTGISFGTDTVTINTGGVARVTTDSSGNVGVGTSSPALNLEVAGATTANGATGIRITDKSANLSAQLFRTGSTYSYAGVGANETWLYSQGPSNLSLGPDGAGAVKFVTNGSERGRFDNSGNLLVGTTSNFGSGAVIQAFRAAGTDVMALQTNTTNTQGIVRFYNPNGAVGNINTSGSSTAYATSSDYRLKENVAPMTGALAKNDLLNPVTYKWKADGSDGQGFIAHELQAVFPDAVTGEKDAVDDENKPVYQGVDTSFLVGHLVACVKELKAELDSVKAELATLKGAA